jgi:hypothetical protein
VRLTATYLAANVQALGRDPRVVKWGVKSGVVLGAFIIITTLGFVSAQETPIHAEIRQVYDLQPHLLTQQQMAQNSRVLDQFWTRAEERPELYVAALRQELGNFANPSFFLYDGSILLLSLSDTPADRKTALAAISRCDLRDLKATDYFLQVHHLAVLNEDTTAAAFHVLERPDFEVVFGEHVLTLGQDYALVYLLLPTEQNYWLGPAIARIGIERDQTAQQSLLLLLWYAQTDTADKAVRDFAADAAKPAAVRSYAQGLIARKGNLGPAQRAEAMGMTEQSLRQKRRERLKEVSDEALRDLDNYTMMLMSKRD